MGAGPIALKDEELLEFFPWEKRHARKRLEEERDNVAGIPKGRKGEIHIPSILKKGDSVQTQKHSVNFEESAHGVSSEASPSH